MSDVEGEYQNRETNFNENVCNLDAELHGTITETDEPLNDFDRTSSADMSEDASKINSKIDNLVMAMNDPSDLMSVACSAIRVASMVGTSSSSKNSQIYDTEAIVTDVCDTGKFPASEGSNISMSKALENEAMSEAVMEVCTWQAVEVSGVEKLTTGQIESVVNDDVMPCTGGSVASETRLQAVAVKAIEADADTSTGQGTECVAGLEDIACEKSHSSTQCNAEQLPERVIVIEPEGDQNEYLNDADSKSQKMEEKHSASVALGAVEMCGLSECKEIVDLTAEDDQRIRDITSSTLETNPTDANTEMELHSRKVTDGNNSLKTVTSDGVSCSSSLFILSMANAVRKHVIPLARPNIIARPVTTTAVEPVQNMLYSRCQAPVGQPLFEKLEIQKDSGQNQNTATSYVLELRPVSNLLRDIGVDLVNESILGDAIFRLADGCRASSRSHKATRDKIITAFGRVCHRTAPYKYRYHKCSCQFVAVARNELEKHLECGHPIAVRTDLALYKCCLCTRQPMPYADFSSHMWEAHKRKARFISSKSVLQCPLCTYETTNSSSYMNHVKNCKFAYNANLVLCPTEADLCDIPVWRASGKLSEYPVSLPAVAIKPLPLLASSATRVPAVVNCTAPAVGVHPAVGNNVVRLPVASVPSLPFTVLPVRLPQPVITGIGRLPMPVPMPLVKQKVMLPNVNRQPAVTPGVAPVRSTVSTVSIPMVRPSFGQSPAVADPLDYSRAVRNICSMYGLGQMLRPSTSSVPAPVRLAFGVQSARLPSDGRLVIRPGVSSAERPSLSNTCAVSAANSPSMSNVKCEICDREFLDYTYLANHMDRVHEIAMGPCHTVPSTDQNLQCKQCPQRLLSADELDRHVRQMHQSATRCACVWCKRRDIADLLGHIADEHKISLLEMWSKCTCIVCLRQTASVKALKWHLLRCHNDVVPPEKILAVETAHKNGSGLQNKVSEKTESGNVLSSLQVNTSETATGNTEKTSLTQTKVAKVSVKSEVKLKRKLKCELCQSSFTNAKKLLLHEEKEHIFRCSRCVQSFSSPDTLRMHIRAQHQHDTEACPMCAQRIQIGSSMTRHIKKTHLRECSVVVRRLSSAVLRENLNLAVTGCNEKL